MTQNLYCEYMNIILFLYVVEVHALSEWQKSKEPES